MRPNTLLSFAMRLHHWLRIIPVITVANLGQTAHAVQPQVSAGGNHSLLLKSDGTVWASGGNSSGILGDGTTTNRSTPVRVISGIQAVSAGGWHSLFLKSDGTVWASGSNNYGQLGDGTTTNRLTPVQVMSGVKSVSTGDGNSLFLKMDSTVWASGYNNYGQLGDGTTTNRISPVQVMSGVSAVSIRDHFALFLKTDGTVWASGYNQQGQLGDGTTINRSTPVQVMSGVRSVSAGVYQSIFLKLDGTVWTSGGNSYGQLGDGTTIDRSTPVQVMSGVSEISAGGVHNMFVKSDGTVWASGYNGEGRLGDGTTIDRSTPVLVMSGVRSVSAGVFHSIFMRLDGTIWTAGANTHGRLGDGTTTSRTTPVQVFDVKTPSYQIVNGSFTWQQAKSDAETKGGRLAVLDTTTKITQANTLLTNAGWWPFLWIGLTDNAVEGDWRWLNGTQLGANNWNPGEPSGENFAMIYPSASLYKLKWNDALPDVIKVNETGYLLEFLPLAVAPVITAGPIAQQTILVGASVSLSITATGTPSPTYQWRKGGVDIAGATDATLAIASVQVADSGIYTCAVTNSAGTVVSEPATLTVSPPIAPQLTLDGFYESLPGADLTVSAIPSGGFPASFTYQWYFNGFLIPANFGGTASNYAIAGNSANNGSWKVVVTNSAGSSEKTFVYQVFTDTDGDGLSNYRETILLSTNPNLADTDGDTLSDYAEVFTHQTNPRLADEDADGLDDAEELLAGTISNDADSDNDGLLDGAEVVDHETNPLSADTDGDALSDYAEVVTHKTDPSEADTDGDGLNDKEEVVTYQTNPLSGDSDGDNLLDKEELVTHNSNPNLKDTDGDGSDDGFEVATGYNPASTTSRPDAALAIQQAVEIKFLAAAGQIYRIEHSNDLTTWTVIEANIAGQNASVRRLFSLEGYQGRFFRVVRQ